MVYEKTITEDGNSHFIPIPNGEWVIEVICSDWSGASATLKRIVNDSNYTVQDAAGDIVFEENGGRIVAGGACYFLEVSGLNNEITFKATPF